MQFLNARYYDPELALFIQPDWLAVTEQGVGTNRYAYANNDPINKFDPNGNAFFGLIVMIAGMLGAEIAISTLVVATLADSAVALHNGADPKDVLKSAVIQFAILSVSSGLPGEAKGTPPRYSSKGFKAVDDAYRALKNCKTQLCQNVMGKVIKPFKKGG